MSMVLDKSFIYWSYPKLAYGSIYYSIISDTVNRMGMSLSRM